MPFSMGHNSFKSKPVFTSSAGGDHVPPPCWISPSDTWNSRLWFLLQSCMLTRPAFVFHEHALIFILNLLWLGSNRAFITCLALSAGVVIYTKLSLCTALCWIYAFFFFFLQNICQQICLPLKSQKVNSKELQWTEMQLCLSISWKALISAPITASPAWSTWRYQPQGHIATGASWEAEVLFGKAHCNAKVSKAKLQRERNLRHHHCGSHVCWVLLPGLWNILVSFVFHSPLPCFSRAQGRDRRLPWKGFCRLTLHHTAVSRGTPHKPVWMPDIPAQSSCLRRFPSVTCFPPPLHNFILYRERGDQEQVRTGTGQAATQCCGADRSWLGQLWTLCQPTLAIRSPSILGAQWQMLLTPVCPDLPSQQFWGNQSQERNPAVI